MGKRTYKSYGDNTTVLFKDDQETKDKVFQYLLDNYFFKYECFSGECIMQSDDPMIYAPEVMSVIADDIIQFDFTDGEEDD